MVDVVTTDHAPASGPRPGLRERKKLETRRVLGLTAMRLAIERGLENVLVEDIAAEAGVSPRTFRNYFSGKYEAICALAVDRARRIGAELRERPAGEPLWDAITHAVIQQYGEAEAAPGKEWIDGVRLVTSTLALQGEYLKAQAVMQRELAEAIAERTGGDVDDDMFPAIIAGAVTAASGVAIDRWINADPPTPLVPLMKRALRELVDGLPKSGGDHDS